MSLAGCRSAPEAAAFRGAPVGPDRFGLVLLRTGENPPELTEAERNEASAGHFAFMQGAAERNELLVAGPFGQPKDAEDLRGLFLFDEDTLEEIVEMAGGDPTTQLGVFRQEVMTLDTLDLVRHLPDMHRAREKERAAAGETGPDMASYTVLFAEQGREAMIATAGSLFDGRVLLLGRLGAPREDGLFGVLDIADPEEARARLAASGLDVTKVELARWYATPLLKEFAKPPAEESDEPQAPGAAL